MQLTQTGTLNDPVMVELLSPPVPAARNGLVERVQPNLQRGSPLSIQALGQHLYELALPGRIGEEFTRFRQQHTSDDKPVRLVIGVRGTGTRLPELRLMPWELLHDGEGWLARQPNITIRRDFPANTGSSGANNPVRFPIRILALCAEPRSGLVPAIRGRRSLDELTAAIHAASRHVQCRPLPAATHDEFKKTLFELKPHIVHFIGHAGFMEDESGQGYLALEMPEEQAGVSPLTATELGSWMSDLGADRPRLVVLNACHTAYPGNIAYADVAAACLSAGVEAVVAMQAILYTDEAKTIGQRLYSSLATMRGLDEGVGYVRRAPELVGERPRVLLFPGRYQSGPSQIISALTEDRRPESSSMMTTKQDKPTISLPGWAIPVFSTRSQSEFSFPRPPATLQWAADNSEMVFIPDLDVYVDRFPITRGQYRRFNRETHHHHRLPFVSLQPWQIDQLLTRTGLDNYQGDRDALDNLLPATSITLSDAKAYAVWAGKHIPSLEEWQQAAWAGGEALRDHPWVDGDHLNRINCDHCIGTCWHFEVAEALGNRNPLGLYDMVGNVAEWAFDELTNRAFRCGGSFKDSLAECTIRSFALARDSRDTNGGVGFRCFATLDEYIRSLSSRGDISA